MRVILADDHPIVLDGLSQLLAREADIEVIARCSTGRETLEAVRRERPDILVLDLAMPEGDGLSVLQSLRAGPFASVRVVILSAALDEEALLQAVRLGVKGVVLKEMAPDLLLRCLRTVAAGGQWLERGLVGRALDRLLKDESDARKLAEVLTAREVEIVRQVAAGRRNKEIARALGITEGTVKIHVHRIYEKLGLDNRVALAAYARDHGLQ